MGKDLQNIKEQTSEKKLTTHFYPKWLKELIKLWPSAARIQGTNSVSIEVNSWPPNQSRDVDMFGFSVSPSPWISRRLQYSCHHILAPKWDSVMTLHSVSGSLCHTRQRKSNDSTLRSVSDPSAENLVPLTSSCDWTQILIMLDVNASRSLTQPSGLLLLYIYSR